MPQAFSKLMQAFGQEERRMMCTAVEKLHEAERQWLAVNKTAAKALTRQPPKRKYHPRCFGTGSR